MTDRTANLNAYRAKLGKQPITGKDHVAPPADHAAPPQGKKREAPHRKAGGGGLRKQWKWKPKAPDPAGAAPAEKGKRWTRVFDADADRIRNCQAPDQYPVTLALWYELVREAGYKRSCTFEASDAYLSRRIPGMRSRNTIRNAAAILQSLGMLTSESRVVPGTKNREPLVRTIHPASPMPFLDGSPCKAGAEVGEKAGAEVGESEPVFT